MVERVFTHCWPSAKYPKSGFFVRDYCESRDNVEVIKHIYPGLLKDDFRKWWKWPKIVIWWLWSAVSIIKHSRRRWAFPNIRKQIYYFITMIPTCHWWLPFGPVVAWAYPFTNVVCHGTDVKMLLDYSWIAKLTKKSARLVFKWQCVSDHLADDLCKVYPFIDRSKIEVKPMPISSLFQNIRDKKIWLSVGALDKNKNIYQTIDEAVADPNVHLFIFGDGPERLRLESYVEEHGYTPRIHVCGWASTETLLLAYNAADLLVSHSNYEGYGLIFDEARACGCKIRRNDVG